MKIVAAGCLLAALAGFGVGFLAARVLRSDKPPSAPAPNSSVTASHTSAARDQISPNSEASAKDRMQGIATLVGRPESLDNDRALYLAVQQLSARDLLAGADEMLALLGHIDHPRRLGRSGYGLGEAWLRHWLEVDANAALHYLGSTRGLDRLFLDEEFIPAVTRAGGAQGAAFRVLARLQPGWTEAYLKAMTPGRAREGPLYSFLQETALRDSTHAAQVLANLGHDPDRPAAMEGYVSGLAKVDPQAAFAASFAEPLGLARNGLLSISIEESAKHGLSAYRGLLAQIDDSGLRRELAAGAFRTLIANSSEDLLPFIAEETGQIPSTMDHAARNGIDHWASWVAFTIRKRPDQANVTAEWAASLANDPEQRILTNVLWEWDWNARKPGEVQSWLATHASDLTPSAVFRLGELFSSMTKTEPDAFASWAGALPPGALRDAAQLQLVLNATSTGNVKLAASIYNSMAPGDADGAEAERLAQGLSKSDGAAVAQWVSTLAPGPARDRAFVAVAREWSRADSRSAADWVEALPPGREHDVAVKEYADSIAYLDPSAATASVENLQDPKLRAEAAWAVYWTWQNEDPVTSRQWLLNLTGLDERLRTRYLHSLR